MKFSTIVLSFVTIAAAQAADNLRSLEQRELSKAMDLIDSEECTDYVSEISMAVTDFLDNKESNIAAYICNPIERKAIKKAEKKMEQDVEEEAKGPCALAAEKLIVAKKDVVKTALKTSKACREEVKKEIAAVKPKDDDERRLFICGGLCVGGIGLLGSAIGPTVTAATKRRRLSKLAVSLDYEDVEDVIKVCNNEEYELSMYVESRHGNPHINMVASPLDSTSDKCNEAFVFDDYVVGERLISFVDDLDFAEDWKKESLSLGTFVFGEMKAASDSARIIMPFQFNAMTNNCATFVIDMMEVLKIPIDNTVLQYVVDTLVTHADYVNLVGGNAKMMVGPDGKPPQEHQVKMMDFVSKYAEDKKGLN